MKKNLVLLVGLMVCCFLFTVNEIRADAWCYSMCEDFYRIDQVTVQTAYDNCKGICLKNYNQNPSYNYMGCLDVCYKNNFEQSKTVDVNYKGCTDACDAQNAAPDPTTDPNNPGKDYEDPCSTSGYCPAQCSYCY